MAGLPEYIERGGQQVFRQPLDLYGVRIECFALDADHRALSRLCDRFLTGPAGGRVRFVPLVSKVLLGFARIDKATSGDPRDSSFGWIPEADVAFWVPVAVLVEDVPGSGDWHVDDVAWFLPYVFVDNAWAMATGREIYGFPKEVGRFSFPNTRRGEHTVDVLSLSPHSPESSAAWRRLLTLRHDAPDARGVEQRFDDVVDAFQEIMGSLFGARDVIRLLVHEGVDLDLGVNVFDYFTHTVVPMVFLKQFRAVEDATKACYQKVITANADIMPGGFAGAGVLWGDYTLELEEIASHPIAQDLGLEAGRNHVDEAFWAEFSFRMQEGAEI